MQDFGGGSTKVRMGLAVKIVMEEQILKRKDLELTLDGIGAQTVLQFSLTVPCALHISGLVTTNLENPMNSMKRQNDRILKDELHRSVGAQHDIEKSGEITPQRMKRWSQNKNNTQLWM